MRKKDNLVDVQNTNTPSEVDKNQIFSVRFKVKKVLFQDEKERNDFAIINAMVPETSIGIRFDNLESIISGTIVNPKVGDYYNATGKIVDKGEYGYQIKLETIPELEVPKEKAEAVKFITNKIKGLGKTRAGIIYDYFQANTFKKLAENTDELKNIPNLKITQNFIDKIKDEFSLSFVIPSLMAHLSLLNLETSFAYPFYEKYGNDALVHLRDNPYLMTEDNPYLFPRIDKAVANRNKATKDLINPTQGMDGFYRYKAAIKYFLFRELVNSGSLAIPEKELYNAFTTGKFLDSIHSLPKGTEENRPNQDKITDVLKQLEESEYIALSKNKKGDVFVYDSKSWKSESKLIKNIKKFNKNGSSIQVGSWFVDKFITEMEEREGIKLADNQKLAVDLLANNKISILTGGPGTGKTHTLKAIKAFIDFLYSEKYISSNSIALLAPTGKASRRMSEVLGVEAQTIHRKLHLVGFGNDEEPEKIEEDFVIVDESSMIDIHLFSILLESLGKNTNLLIVGDANQLPSVGAGLVLRDLIDSRKVPTIILDKVFRQGDGSLIAENARKIKDGIKLTDGKSDNSLIFQSNNKKELQLKDSYFVESKTTSETKDLLQRILYKVQNVYKIPLEDIMILTAQKKGEVGTYKINKEIQETLLGQGLLREDEGLLRTSDNSVFYVNDPVIQTVNDYENDVFNGEVGRVESVNFDKKEIQVNFEGKIVVYTGSKVDDINLAYAITYHKSQGSESPVVIQIVDESQVIMLNRSLIYTGYTRTQKNNFIIGQRNILNQSIDDVSNLERYSLIKEQL